LLQEPENDLSNLLARFRETNERVDKNLNLLTSLIAIGAGKHNLEENHGVVRLTVLATIFLPFSTIATVLSMQGNFAPGAGEFWIYWVAAFCLVTLVAAVFLRIDARGRAFLMEIGKSFKFKEKKRNLSQAV